MNQDSFACDGVHPTVPLSDTVFPVTGVVSASKGSVFGVFDGMGGEERGEVAAHIAAKKAAELSPQKDSVLALNAFCNDANSAICDYMKENGVSSMGTTAAMLCFTKSSVTLCNIGDSRVYRLNKNELSQLSKDHLSITAFGKKAPLSQNLGIPPDELIIEPYVSVMTYKDRDKYLICSDGLTDHVTDEEIENILKLPSDIASETLLKAALDGGGRDNVTLIVLEITKNSLINLFNRMKGEKP